MTRACKSVKMKTSREDKFQGRFINKMYFFRFPIQFNFKTEWNTPHLSSFQEKNAQNKPAISRRSPVNWDTGKSFPNWENWENQGLLIIKFSIFKRCLLEKPHFWTPLSAQCHGAGDSSSWFRLSSSSSPVSFVSSCSQSCSQGDLT